MPIGEPASQDPPHPELRTSILMAWFWVGGGSFMAFGSVMLLRQEWSETFSENLFYILFLLWPATVLAVGLDMLLRPKLVLRLADEHLELYLGSFFVNPRMVQIPVESIRRIDFRPVSSGRGGTDILILFYLEKELTPAQAPARSVKWFLKRAGLQNSPEPVIAWAVGVARGGFRAADRWLRRNLPETVIAPI
ncbi:MAG: hypothetical protein AAGK14_09915 [Verrucomicrobiota bacterium]